MRMLASVQPTFNTLYNNTISISVPVNRKGMFTVEESLAASELAAIQNSIPDMVTAWAVAGTPNSYAFNQFMLRRHIQTVTIVNAVTAGIMLKAHLCVPRRDLSLNEAYAGDGTITAADTPTSWIRSGLQMRGLGLAMQAGQAANVDPLLLSQTSVTPFDSPTFTEAFKVVKTRQQFLLGGTQMHLKRVIRGPKLVKSSRYRQNTDGGGPIGTGGANGGNMNDHLRGLTAFWLLEVIGQPVADSADNTLIGTANLKLDILVNRRTEWTYVAQNAAYGSVAGALDVVGNAEFIDPMQDEPEAVQNN